MRYRVLLSMDGSVSRLRKTLKYIDIDEALERLEKRIPQPLAVPDPRVLEYLKSGIAIDTILKPMFDLVDTTRHLPPPVTLTDGHWARGNIDIYYIEEYNIPVPDEFVQHVASRNFVPPDAEEFQSILNSISG